MNGERLTGLAIANGMTLSRPLLAEKAVKAAKKDDWRKAGLYFSQAFITDLDGKVARFFGATTRFGAIADPIADFLLRTQLIRALAPVMNKPILAGITALELDILRINGNIQKGRKTFIIPFGAKVGTTVQGVGALAFCEGMHNDDHILRRQGELTVLAGSVLRNTTYRTLR